MVILLKNALFINISGPKFQFLIDFIMLSESQTLKFKTYTYSRAIAVLL